MKTSTPQFEKNKIRKDLQIRFSGVLIFIIILLMILGANKLFSQKNQNYKLGLGISSNISGNAHGTIYTLSSHLYNGKNLFGIGACVQKRKENVCGVKLNYMRFITGKEVKVNEKFEPLDGYSRTQLFFYSSVQYIQNGYLSFGAVKREELLNNNSEVASDFSNFKLSTAEACIGFGLNIKITEQLVLSNYIGFGAYYHMNYNKPMYTEKAAPMLVLGTALRLNYFKN